MDCQESEIFPPWGGVINRDTLSVGWHHKREIRPPWANVIKGDIPYVEWRHERETPPLLVDVMKGRYPVVRRELIGQKVACLVPSENAVTLCCCKLLGKMLSRILSDCVDSKLRKKKDGFRQGRRMTEHIFVFRNIVRQKFKWTLSLYECFIDYENAYGTVYG